MPNHQRTNRGRAKDCGYAALTACLSIYPMKAAIVAERLGPDVRPSEVIRKYGITTSGQLYAWRQQLSRRVAEPLARVSASFARVEAATGEGAVRAPET